MAPLINFVAVVCYAISSFGNGILYVIGWQMCSRFSSICSGLIPLAVIHISVACSLLLPAQAIILRKRINWKLAFHLFITQQIGLYFGIYALFSFTSVWLPRFLGLTFLCVAMHKLQQETKLVKEKTVIVPCDHMYTFTSWREYGLVWITGLTSGVFGGMFATSGPPVMLFVSYVNLDKNETRATIAVTSCLENIARLVFILFWQTDYDVHSVSFLYLALLLIVSSGLALGIGNAVAKYVNQTIFRYIMLLLLTLGSVMLLTTGLDTFISISVFVLCMFLFATYVMVSLDKIPFVKHVDEVRVQTTTFAPFEFELGHVQHESYGEHTAVNDEEV